MKVEDVEEEVGLVSKDEGHLLLTMPQSVT